MRPKDLVGHRFHRLLALAPTADRDGRAVVWDCICDCGQTAKVGSTKLLSGNTRSCGCLCRDVARALPHDANLQHGAARGGKKSPEYGTWLAMKDRCYRKRSVSYPLYGGRGISVCDKWRDSFDAFLADVGTRPTPTHSIERMDNDGDYEPGNCRWATPAEQSANRRVNRLLTFNGRTQTTAAWAREAGISRQILRARLGLGWPLWRALTTVPRKPRNGSDGRFVKHFSPPSR